MGVIAQMGQGPFYDLTAAVQRAERHADLSALNTQTGRVDTWRMFKDPSYLNPLVPGTQVRASTERIAEAFGEVTAGLSL